MCRYTDSKAGVQAKGPVKWGKDAIVVGMPLLAPLTLPVQTVRGRAVSLRSGCH